MLCMPEGSADSRTQPSASQTQTGLCYRREPERRLGMLCMPERQRRDSAYGITCSIRTKPATRLARNRQIPAPGFQWCRVACGQPGEGDRRGRGAIHMDGGGAGPGNDGHLVFRRPVDGLPLQHQRGCGLMGEGHVATHSSQGAAGSAGSTACGCGLVCQPMGGVAARDVAPGPFAALHEIAHQELAFLPVHQDGSAGAAGFSGRRSIGRGRSRCWSAP